MNFPLKLAKRHLLSLGEEQNRGAPALQKKCSEIIVEFVDDCWPDIRRFSSMSRHDNRLLCGVLLPSFGE
jgi:hypothetical protein